MKKNIKEKSEKSVRKKQKRAGQSLLFPRHLRLSLNLAPIYLSGGRFISPPPAKRSPPRSLSFDYSFVVSLSVGVA
ncbi:unnamed protein product [Arabis nemorensis]|uniref:Uncharacterized protein n=1 Tax=Arabis nemorensis TaxID=586526 RepID=A0A565CTP0_9BRAS|nr:unnamed protein product [Arabis nemorensis]